MQIADNCFVEMDYVLKDNQGNLIDSSEGHGPLSYVQGKGHIIPGLETEMAGKGAGDEFTVVVSPADGYGEKNDQLVYKFPKDDFAAIENLEPGIQVEMNDGQQSFILTVVDVADDEVTVDGNHPLAGVELHFDINVRNVREATEEEMNEQDHNHDHDCNCDEEGCNC